MEHYYSNNVKDKGPVLPGPQRSVITPLHEDSDQNSADNHYSDDSQRFPVVSIHGDGPLGRAQNDCTSIT